MDVRISKDLVFYGFVTERGAVVLEKVMPVRMPKGVVYTRGAKDYIAIIGACAGWGESPRTAIEDADQKGLRFRRGSL